MKFLTYSPEQAYLLPPSVYEVLGEDHLCFFLHRAVEALDLTAFEQGYVEEGRPAYHPALLLKVWLYAYALGVTASRRLEQRVREDLAFRYLAGGATPDFWTLSEFRRRHGRALNDRRMRQKLRDPAGRRVYARRKGIVELVFGVLKQQRGRRRFRRRGLEKVGVEFALAATAFNLTRLWRLKPALG